MHAFEGADPSRWGRRNVELPSHHRLVELERIKDRKAVR